MQYYAYDLLKKSSYTSHVTIPKIYKVAYETPADSLGKCIVIYMQYLPKYELNEAQITPAFFRKWGPIIKGVFGYFLENNLAHFDTSPSNVYFTNQTPDGKLKLCIIDFGESIMPQTEGSLVSRRAQYTGILKKQTFEEFKTWIDKKQMLDVLKHTSNDLWGGIKRKTRRIRKQHMRKTQCVSKRSGKRRCKK